MTLCQITGYEALSTILWDIVNMQSFMLSKKVLNILNTYINCWCLSFVMAAIIIISSMYIIWENELL